MSTFITGLKDIGKLVDEGDTSTAPKTRWLKVAPGQTVNVRFVNELDEDSPHYDSSRGLALVAYEHTNPKDFRRKAVCTMESEGRCFGCEMNQRQQKGWYRKPRFYINVLVDNGNDEPFVATWSMGVRRSTTFEMIREYAIDTGSISNLKWRLKRTGEGTDTTWTLIPTAPDAVPFDWSGVEVPNLEAALRQVPYADQETFYLAVNSNTDSEKDEVAESSVPW
jgi:hypothetical protein